MLEDAWLAERLGCAAWWVPPETNAAELRDHAARNGPAFYQAKVDAHDVAAVRELSAAGMAVVDLNLTVARDADQHAAPAMPVVEAGPEHGEGVREIAAADYEVSRFHMDDQVPPAVASRIKRDWVQAYLDGARGERLLVVERDGRPAGFLAELASGETRVIDLFAVRAAERGAGIGRALVLELLRTAPGRVEAGTQAANVRALRFYESLGFRAERARYVLHLHARAA
jgi:dTDP-4-amino-4,6-dideoxy-D-galactose acyltransferase